jgi:NTE family protein
MLRLLWFGFALLVMSGCASYGVIDNVPEKGVVTHGGYSIRSSGGARRASDIALILAFSGGGTRAAALSYGVLEELRDTKVVINGRPERLLDEVDTISSVSGGSFTAAYFGLYGDRIFEDFEEAFLRRDIEGYLVRSLFNPLRWFSNTGRTEMAVDYYEKTVFREATFADMQRKDGPMIIINASDLGYGVRFSFLQEYFNLLCSNLSPFPVARAVAASSAVPVLFNPVVLENYADCTTREPDWLMVAAKRAAGDPEETRVVEGLRSYFNKGQRKYVHLVDGGITDNLGLRAIYEIIEVAGGAKAFMQQYHRQPPRRIVIIEVNASTDPEPEMDISNKQPSLKEIINAVTDVQLHRYNTATLELIKNSVERWAEELSTPGRPVAHHFIRIGFRDIQQPETRRFFNRIPTTFSLSDEQVKRLIKAGHDLLRDNPDYQRFVAELGGGAGNGQGGAAAGSPRLSVVQAR